MHGKVSTGNKSLNHSHRQLKGVTGTKPKGNVMTSDFSDEDVLASGDWNFDIDSGWELRGKPNDPDDPARAICRWCYIYQFIDSEDDSNELSRIAGVAAGYTGGGVFAVRMFYLESTNLIDASRLFTVQDLGGDLDNSDEWYDLDSTIQEMAYEARNVLLNKWVDEGSWIGAGQLLLQDEMVSNEIFVKQDDMLYACTDNDDPWTKVLRNDLGLTAGRVFDGE
jgi:hypothetical protein